ncbi:MAG: CRTAC1 family protein [Candidatus Poribacteria bacterium]|nr:CRTAC1 family protein [Candidatus Poribacteria bacterium]
MAKLKFPKTEPSPHSGELNTSDGLRQTAFVSCRVVFGVFIVLWTMGVGMGSSPAAGENSSGEKSSASAAPTAAVSMPAVKSSPTAPPGHKRMLKLLQQIADETPDENSFLGDAKARTLRKQIAEFPAGTSDRTKWMAYMQLGHELLHLGHELEGIEYLERALHLTRTQQDAVPVEVLNHTHYRLGVAYMRRGETENCCLRNRPESCILPLRGGGIHTQQESSLKAIAFFGEVLQRTPQRASLHLGAQWLINIAYMTIGGYPDRVPESYLIPPIAFESEEEFPRFANVAPRLGLDTFDLSGGAVIDDFDNDDYLDIVTSTWDTDGQLRFFRNNQDGTFTERTMEAGLIGLYGGLNMVQADYDNDGDTDILVLRGAWIENEGQHPNSLLRNNGAGTFTDVTFESGLGAAYYPSGTASWGDYDNDGYLDLYIGNESSKALRAPCQLFRNNGDGTFTDLAAKAGVRNYRFSKSAIWGDYDGDGWLDLYISNYKGGNRLYHNNRDGTFTNVARKLNVDLPEVSFPAWFWDFDNDGRLDLYVSAYSANIEHLAASWLDIPVETEFACLYRGNSTGGFDEVARQYNLIRPTAPMGSNFGDLDNDGFLDFYLGTGYPDYENIMPNVMCRNQGGKRFVDVSVAGGFSHVQKGHGAVFADLDNDGDQDVFEQMGGALPGDAYNNVLYENPGFDNHWITIKLIGVRSNRSAIGVRICAKVVENGDGRSIYKHVNSGGTFGANPLRQAIGLGSASNIEHLEIFWPTTGNTQTFHNVASNQFIQIVEGEDRYTTISLNKPKLSGGD